MLTDNLNTELYILFVTHVKFKDPQLIYGDRSQNGSWEAAVIGRDPRGLLRALLMFCILNWGMVVLIYKYMKAYHPARLRSYAFPFSGYTFIENSKQANKVTMFSVKTSTKLSVFLALEDITTDMVCACLQGFPNSIGFSWVVLKEGVQGRLPATGGTNLFRSLNVQDTFFTYPGSPNTIRFNLNIFREAWDN